MRYKDVIKLILIHVTVFITAFILFVILFKTPIFAGIDVLFYRGILVIALVSAVSGMFVIILKIKYLNNLLTYRDVILSVTIIFCVNLVFFTHLPVTADRSVSVFVLGYLNENSDRIVTEKEMKDFFIKKYVVEYNAINRRFSEQIESGNVVFKENGYIITSRGKLLIKMYDKIADLFNINKKFIAPTNLLQY